MTYCPGQAPGLLPTFPTEDNMAIICTRAQEIANSFMYEELLRAYTRQDCMIESLSQNDLWDAMEFKRSCAEKEGMSGFCEHLTCIPKS